jgi:hypothetical protein
MFTQSIYYINGFTSNEKMLMLYAHPHVKQVTQLVL